LLVYIQKQKVLSSNFDGEPGVILDGIEALALYVRSRQIVGRYHLS
jgi:hypothetical protein